MGTITSLFEELKSLRPLNPNDQSRLDRKFMLEFNYNSNHIEGNTLTYGETEILLLFGRVVNAANMKDLEEMKAHNICLKMVEEEAQSAEKQLTETFIRQLHKTLLREDYTIFKKLPGGEASSYTVHAGCYKTRPNSVITITGERFEYASQEETPSLMFGLINWYNEAEKSGKYSPLELITLFHYRYIRIHPFEDGNGRIVRLLINYILLKHKYPMIVVKSSTKSQYLDALHSCDVIIGLNPTDGAKADLQDLEPFKKYLENCLIEALTISIKAAKGESIEEDDDFDKEIQLIQRKLQNKENQKRDRKPKDEEEVWNVLEFVYFPIVKQMGASIKSVSDLFNYSSQYNLLSKKKERKGGIHINEVMRGIKDSDIIDYVRNASSMWYVCDLQFPKSDVLNGLTISETFHVDFEEYFYTIQGIDDKEFLYGTYPTEKDIRLISSDFKKHILDIIKEKTE